MEKLLVQTQQSIVGSTLTDSNRKGANGTSCCITEFIKMSWYRKVLEINQSRIPIIGTINFLAIFDRDNFYQKIYVRDYSSQKQN